ncbi:MAG: TetR/AcrR family transcriptional regulator [Pseudomonadota bacterium]
MSTRVANKQKRREQILEGARALLLEGGYDAFTTRKLAERSGVSVPTIYNLIGGKEDVLSALIASSEREFWDTVEFPKKDDDLDAIESFFNQCVDVSVSKPAEMASFVLVADRIPSAYAFLGYEHPDQPGVGAQSVAFTTKAASVFLDAGFLTGRIATATMGEHFFSVYRNPHRDWAHGVITANEFRRRFVRSAMLVMCADANDITRQQLFRRIEALDTAAESSAEHDKNNGSQSCTS